MDLIMGLRLLVFIMLFLGYDVTKPVTFGDSTFPECFFSIHSFSHMFRQKLRSKELSTHHEFFFFARALERALFIFAFSSLDSVRAQLNSHQFVSCFSVLSWSRNMAPWNSFHVLTYLSHFIRRNIFLTRNLRNKKKVCSGQNINWLIPNWNAPSSFSFFAKDIPPQREN